ncbi:MAG: two-component system, OmpR family, sensor histidine kinase BaeS [Nocardioidaceae bacterium]|nr:two-component system, OmpR family, sensor histidine kinase BaeS [Nocardioidaceae bacterium]
MSAPQGPLDRISSVKIKLGVLVAASVAVAAILATVGSGVAPWLSIPVTILMALAVTQLLATGMTSPLRQMTRVASQMARGDYSGRVHTNASDEVGQLARAFNSMAHDLETVDRQRRELVANVSHELRTPLTALCVVLENLVDGVAQPDPAGLQVALDQAERLSHLVEDLLDLSRVEAGIAPLELQSIRVEVLLERAATEAAAGPHPVTYDVRVQPPGLTVQGDPARLQQLVANLLDNAARHSPSGATVMIAAAERGQQWSLEVADQGPGIDPENRDHVFERFGTLAQQTGGSTGGTGLGLAIARWVTDLHQGSIGFVDPVDGGGALVRAVLPIEPVAPVQSTTPEENAMPTTQAPQPRPPHVETTDTPSVAAVFGSFWPEIEVPARTNVLLACAAVGVLAGLVIPEHDLGLGTFLVLMAAGATVFLTAKNRRDPFTISCAVFCFLLSVPVVLRDADWIAVPCLLIGALLCAVGIARGRSLPDFVVAAAAAPMAGLRGMPWLGRTVRSVTGSGRAPAVARTAALSLAGLVVFGLLFASADAVFSDWVGKVVPDLSVDTFALRAFVAVAIGGVVLAASYMALNPPAIPLPAGGARRPVQQRYEWLAPVALVDLVFLLFLVAQATAFFGGHDYIRRTTGLTYAEHVHQGFGQLTVATVLTLLVVWAASHKAPVETASDRAWLRGALGLLCALTLVVVASALYRMHLYQQAYGFTRLRLLVDVFEGWLGLLVIGVLVAGIALKGGWLPRMALLSSAVMLLGLAAINPDAWIAHHNVERYESTGKVDWHYLDGLSLDAAPVLSHLPEADRACALASYVPPKDDWLGWNYGRSRAEHALRNVTVDATTPCRSVPDAG